MDLSPGQQKAVFVLIVIVLAVFGYWLVLPKLTHSHGPGPAAASSTPTASVPSSAPAAAVTAPASAVTAPPTRAGTVNIYSWLPFTQQDLAAAAAVAVQFGIDYDTFTYTESAASYVGKMGSLVTGELAATLRADYQIPGVAKLRASQKQVSIGTAVIDSLRAFGPSSLTFVITAGQRLVSESGTTSGSTRYAVTVTGSGDSWQVSDIELESAGNT